MKQVNIFEAKTDFSKLIRMLESGKEKDIIISKYGRPVARLSLFKDAMPSKRIGAAKGKLRAPADLDKYNAEIEELFGGTL